MGTGLSLGAGLLSAFYPVSIRNSEQKDTTPEDVHGEYEEIGTNVNIRASLFDYPYVFWQLGLICMLGIWINFQQKTYASVHPEYEFHN